MSLTGLIKLVVQTTLVCLIFAAATYYLEKKFNHSEHLNIINQVDENVRKILWTKLQAGTDHSSDALLLVRYARQLPKNLKILTNTERFRLASPPQQTLEYKMDAYLNDSLNASVLEEAKKQAPQYENRHALSVQNLKAALQQYVSHVISDERLYKISSDFELAVQFLKHTNSYTPNDAQDIAARSLSWQTCPLCAQMRDVLFSDKQR